MGSVNKQQLVGCWLGYSTADARLFLEFEMCSSVGFFFGGEDDYEFPQRRRNYAICRTLHASKINAPSINDKKTI